MKLRLLVMTCLIAVLTGCAVTASDDTRARYEFGSNETTEAEMRRDHERFAAFP